MPLKTEEMEEPALNLTPMVDVVFLLNIFFMVGTQIQDTELQYQLQLPSVAEAQPLTNLPDEIVVGVTNQGIILVDGEPKTPAQLEQLLRAAHDNFAGQAVVIRGDAQVPYQNVVNVFEICHKAQIQNISIHTRVAEDPQR
ncbi:MAG: biopolymer transporter ExbD [Planctomycetaceae bacterium]